MSLARQNRKVKAGTYPEGAEVPKIFPGGAQGCDV